MKNIALGACIAAGLFASTSAHADSNGKTGVSTTGCGGTVGIGCHGARNTATTVQVVGASTVMVGSMNTLRLIITNMAATQTAAGLDVAATGGTLGTNAMAPQTRLSRGEITHNSRIARGASGWSIPFNWTAPMTAGTVTITAAGNAVDGRGSSGDQWNTTTFTVTVTNSMVMDSGVPPRDSGVAPRDSGVITDTGVPVEDTGVPSDDAAGPVMDASAPPPSNDASSNADASTTPGDGGMGMQLGGCRCSTTPSAVNPRLPMLSVAALAAFASKRRRRAAR